ncbi:hypothetical protein [Neorhizobium sp. T6_25]|uniref:hypothetical protein n=1 Tax=Neorhizobium sp. T6_25 TaxID=2093833 RepID=UPI001FDF8194|nr:hypothetical protein [Neorhizobium sp. T6_25]
MFKNLQDELRRLSAQQTISVPLESDAEGYFDKECPDDNCLFQFKIFEQDWKDIVRDEEVFCPSCRHCALQKAGLPPSRSRKPANTQ